MESTNLYYPQHTTYNGAGKTGESGWDFEAAGLNKTGTAAWNTLQGSRTPYLKLEGMVNPNLGVTVSSAPTSVTEGSTATYTVVLDSQPSHSVMITPTSSDTTSVTTSGALTFTTTDWETAKTVTLTGVQDDNPIDESVTISHTVSSMDTGYNNYSIDDFTVTADDNDTASVTVSKTSLSMDEEERDAGGQETGDSYTLVLGTQPGPGERVTITPSTTNRTLLINPTSVSFNENNWNSPVEVKVQSGPDDNLNDETSTITHAVSGYGSSAASIAVTVSDNDTPSVDLSWTNRAIGEGSSATYEIKLGFEPSGTVTVTIVQPTNTDVTIDTDTGLAGNQNTLAFTGGSNGTWSTPQPVTISVGEDSDSAAENATIEHTVAGANYAGTTVGDVIVSVFDSASPGILVSKTTLTISEARGQSTYKVKLATQPTVDVTITPSQFGGLEVLPSSLLFTTANWSTEQTVTVTAPAADNDLASTTVNLVHLISSTDPVYFEGSEGGFMLVTVRDNDTAGITVSPLILSPNEAGSAETYTVVLDYRPSNTVLVKIVGPSGLGMTINPTELEFTSFDWNTPLSVMVSAAADDDLTNEMVTIAHAVTYASAGRWTGLSVDSVSVTVFDDDGPGVSITPTSLGEIDEGATATYDVELNTVPTGNVTVTLAVPTDGGVSVSGTTLSSNELTFTTGNWSTAQRVTVTADEDEDAFNNSGMITHSVSGYGSVNSGPPVTFTVDDNEEAGVVITGARERMDGTFHTTVPEGESTTYKVKLASKPYPDSGTVTVAIGGTSGTDVSVTTPSTASYTFDKDNWNMEQSVTLAAAQDADGVNDEVTITHGITNNGADYGAVNAPNLDVTVTDDETANLVFSNPTVSVNETDADVTATYTVKLSTQPTAAVTVTLTSNNSDVTIDTDTVMPGDQNMLTFSTTNWSIAQTVTLTVSDDADAADDVATISHLASGGDYANKMADVTVSIADDEIRGVTPSFTQSALTEGGFATVFVSLDTQPTDTVTIVASIDPPDSSIVLTGSTTMTFTTTNYADQSNQRIRFEANEDDDGEDEAATIRFVATGGDYGGVTVPEISVTATDIDDKGIEFNAGLLDEPVTQTINVTEGRINRRFGIRLLTEPTGDVEITPVLASNSRLGFVDSDPTLTFTTLNWDDWQTIGFNAAEDDDGRDDRWEIDFNIAGYGTLDSSEEPDPVIVNVADNDSLDVVPGGNFVNGSIEVAEGNTTGSAFTMVLTTKPVDVGTGANSSTTIGFTVPTGLTVTPSSWTFNSGNWSNPKEFRVTAANDPDGVNNEYSVSSSMTGADYNGSSPDPVEIRVIDDDEPMLDISQTSVTVGETATLMNAYTVKPTTQPTGTFTVNLASSNTAKVTVSPPTLTFNAGDWQTPQDVHITGVDDDDAFVNMAMITHTAAMTGTDDDEYEGITGDPVTVTVTETDTRGVTFIDECTCRRTRSALMKTEAASTRSRLTSALPLTPNGGVHRHGDNHRPVGDEHRYPTWT